MKLLFLGTGTSRGIPEIGCKCDTCSSSDPKDKRLRSSVLVQTDDSRILIDCGPDFRQQVIGLPFMPIDGVLITHEHFDHIAGLDDLRPFCENFGDISIYAQQRTMDKLKLAMHYAFNHSGINYGVPAFKDHVIAPDMPFCINNTLIRPIVLSHFRITVLGFRIGNLAYLTDVNNIPESEFSKLQGLDVLILDSLRIKPHISHFNLEESLAVIQRIRPKKSFLIHMSHQLGKHEDIQKLLPENVLLSYDGLEVEF